MYEEAVRTLLLEPLNLEVPGAAEEVETFCGRETVANIVTVAASGEGISLEVIDRPEVLAELGIDPVQEPPVKFMFLPGDGDRIICTAPPYRGSTGFFVRDGDGAVTALNAFGRHTVCAG